MDDGAAHRGWDMLLENGKVSTHLVHHWPDNGLKVVTRKPLSINAWHHVLVTYDGSRKGAGVKIYVDGKLEPTDITNDTLKDTLRTEKPLHIGRRGASLPFKGKLDDLQIFGLELSVDNAVQLAATKPINLVGSLLAIPVEKRTPVQQAAIRRFYLEKVDTEFAKVLEEVGRHPSRRYFVYKSIILNNLFGVDIMAEAVEICKLRLFLKLVSQVDGGRDLEPLPDIDFNIRAGNNLVGYATQAQFDASNTLASDQAHRDEIKASIADLADLFDLSLIHI